MTTPPDQPHQGLGDWSSATRTGQPGAPRNSDPSSSGTGRLLVAGMLIALLAGGAGGATGALIEHRMGQQDANSAADANRQVSAIARATLPSVVTIQIADSTGKPAGTGSGFVIRSQGYIVTNNHVARGAGPDGKLTVQFADNSQVDAMLVGADASYDLAVLKVDRADLPALSYGDSDALIVGQQVIAVGAPLGLTGSVTTGIVSALNRPVTTGRSMTDVSYLNAVQTDAAINPGNSGGPLLDMRGQVVGVNSAIASTGGSSEGRQVSGNIGVGFAIPAAQARRTVDELIRTGKSAHPTIGVQVEAQLSPGARVTSAQDGGSAQQAGVQSGDVITAVDGVKVAGPTAFIVALRSKPIGATVTLTITREGQDRSVAVQTTASTN
ncbi:trypsin-like peptidase domain-containing protein [Dermatophilaceae bacterium Sec6.4]